MKLKKKKLNKILYNKILLYYSTILSTILVIGGFYMTRSVGAFVSNLLFLPIVIFLWILFIQERKEIKDQKQKPKKIKSQKKDKLYLAICKEQEF